MTVEMEEAEDKNAVDKRAFEKRVLFSWKEGESDMA